MSKVPPRSLFHKVFTVGGWTGISRVLGLVRQMIHGGVFGATELQSAFVMAWQIPNLFRRLFGEGALSQAFVPIFTTTVHHEGHATAERLVQRLLTLLILFLGGITLVGILLSYGAQALLPEGNRWQVILPLVRILLPYAPIICAAAITMGILQAQDKFRAPAAAPCLLNIIWITALLFIKTRTGVTLESSMRLLSWSLLAAGVLQFGYLAYVLRSCGYRLRPNFHFRSDPLIRQVVHNACPSIVGNSVLQVNTFLDNVIAFRLAATWAPSCLHYAVILYDLPIGIISTAFSTVLLPTLSKATDEQNPTAIHQTFSSALSTLLVLNIPIGVALVLLTQPIIQFIYQRGAFDPLSAARTARALAFYAAALPFVGLQKTAISLLYARKDIHTPMRIALTCVAVNLFFNILFAYTWAPEWKHAGIAFSTSLSMMLNTVLLFRHLHRLHLVPPLRPILRTALQAILAAALMGFILSLLPKQIVPTLPTLGKLNLSLALTLATNAIVALATYLLALAILTRGHLRPLFQPFRRTHHP